MNQFDDPEYPNITHRVGASGILTPILRGTGIRVQTIAIASQNYSPAEIMEDHGLPLLQVQEALKFYHTHRAEIDAHIQAEIALEPKNE